MLGCDAGTIVISLRPCGSEEDWGVGCRVPPYTIEGEAGPINLDFWGTVTREHSCSPYSALSPFGFPDLSLSIQQPSPPQRVGSCHPIPSGLQVLAWRSLPASPAPPQQGQVGGFQCPFCSLPHKSYGWHPEGKHILRLKERLSFSEFSSAGGKAVSLCNVTLTVTLAEESLLHPGGNASICLASQPCCSLHCATCLSRSLAWGWGGGRG